MIQQGWHGAQSPLSAVALFSENMMTVAAPRDTGAIVAAEVGGRDPGVVVSGMSGHHR